MKAVLSRFASKQIKGTAVPIDGDSGSFEDGRGDPYLPAYRPKDEADFVSDLPVAV
jgi:hypothetical protein